MKLWANNPKKIDSRKLIVDTIWKELGNQKINMFELLGGGIGAKYYYDNLNLGLMTLCENEPDVANAFNFKSVEDKSFLFRGDAQTFFKTFYPKRDEYGKQFFNVTNLDFCAWLYDNGKDNSTSYIIEQMFASGALRDNGLAFFTFQIDGFMIDLYEKRGGVAITEESEIVAWLTKLAAANGYKLDKCVFRNQYKAGSRRGQQMLNLGFRVRKI